MSTHQSVERDERTLAVEDASHGWAYLLLMYALLIDVAYRAFFRNEAAWDLMALVIGGGVLCTVYQARQKILARRWLVRSALVACVAAVISAGIAFVIR